MKVIITGKQKKNLAQDIAIGLDLARDNHHALSLALVQPTSPWGWTLTTPV